MKMCPVEIPWTHLVRYSSTANGPVKYGEPILSQAGDIGKLARDDQLKVKRLLGSDPFLLEKTDVVETVYRLYGPLEPKDVPIVRCIGLNYKTHSKKLLLHNRVSDVLTNYSS
jgi:hypothetical protein